MDGTVTSTQQKHILVVDDEHAITHALSLKFSILGFRVTVCNDGEEALRVLHEVVFDAIICDLVMPRKTGFDLLRARIATPNSDRPFFILSSLAADSDVEEVENLGARKYFVKSRMSIKDVVEEVKAAL